MRIRRTVVVRGRVQGVFFRGSAEQQARAVDVDGWIRNRPDGSVEAVFEGTPEAVETLVAWCRHGPRWARVDDLQVSQQPAAGLTGFEIRG